MHCSAVPEGETVGPLTDMSGCSWKKRLRSAVQVLFPSVSLEAGIKFGWQDYCRNFRHTEDSWK